MSVAAFDAFRASAQNRARLNALLPINARLPPEVLAQIFAAYIHASHDPEEYAGYHRHPPYAWLKIAHVCHYWREVAIQTPSLWSYITLTRLECVKEMIMRSKEAPLSIFTGPYMRSRHPLALLQLAFNEIHRVKNFDLWVPTENLLKLENNERRVAVQLRTLKLKKKRLNGARHTMDRVLSPAYLRLNLLGFSLLPCGVSPSLPSERCLCPP